MRSRTVAVLGVMLALPGIAAPAAAAGGRDSEAALRSAIEADVASDPGIPGEIVAVRAPGFRVTLATGVADLASGIPLEPDTTFRVASMTKTFVAAAVLRLVEQRRVRLEDPITKQLSAETLGVLRADGYDVEEITLRQLLTHTSGLYDYAADDRYLVLAAGDPTHRFTRLEQLRLATEYGDPLGAPGSVHHYSDTGYILLGEVLEQTTGATLPAAVRRLLRFGRLGLEHTYWETLESTPRSVGERAHQYYGTVDNIGFDPSTDLYGGGGLVSTVDDLARFYEALFDGKVFARRASLRTMTTVSARGRAEDAAMGIYVVDAAGERCFGHAGFWGTQTIYCPDLDLTFARTINQGLAEEFDWDALEFVIVDEVSGA